MKFYKNPFSKSRVLCMTAYKWTTEINRRFTGMRTHLKLFFFTVRYSVLLLCASVARNVCKGSRAFIRIIRCNMSVYVHRFSALVSAHDELRRLEWSKWCSYKGVSLYFTENSALLGRPAGECCFANRLLFIVRMDVRKTLNAPCGQNAEI